MHQYTWLMHATRDMPWSAVNTLLLDMDGTLLDLAYDNYFWRACLPQAYARRHGLEATAAQRELFARLAASEGRLEWYCLDHWSRELSIDLVALKRATAERIRYLPGATEFLVRARALGVRLVLVTNAHPATLAIKLARTGLAHHLDAVHSAHDYAVPKEAPEFWQRLATREAFEPARALLLDDNLPVLRSARAYGVAGLVAIRQPDSTQPARRIEEFHSVRGVADLLPALGTALEALEMASAQP